MTNRLLAFFVVAIILLLTYAPLARAKYGFGDDFLLLLSEEPLGYAYLADARPLFALAYHYIHRPMSSLAQFGYLRLMSAIGVAGIAVIFLRTMRLLPGTATERLAIAVALGTLPCLQTYVAQANFWLAIYAAIAVLAAAIVTRDGLRHCFLRDHSNRKAGIAWRFSAAIILMLIAAGTYQPMLSWYWTVVVLYLLSERFVVSARYRREVYWVIALGLAYFVICFVAFKVFLYAYDGGVKSRVALTHNPIFKLYWFFRIQFPLALNFWHLMDSSKRVLTLGIAMMSLLTILSAMMMSWFRAAQVPSTGGRRVVLLRAALLCVAILLTHVHWLVIAIVPQSYRVIAPMGVACLLLMYWSVIEWSKWCPFEQSRDRGRQAFLVVMAIAAVTLCQHYSEKYWIAPHSTAYRYMLMTLRDDIRPKTDRVHLIQQSEQDSFVSEWFIESFGRPASDRDWTITAMVRSALNDTQLRDQIKTISHADGSESVPEDDNTLVIDMRKLKLMRLP